jgi:hypothetical protein
MENKRKKEMEMKAKFGNVKVVGKNRDLIEGY